MTLENVLLYIPAAVLIVLMPGPDFAVITKTALMRGRTAGVICSAGVACGLLVHTTLAALGISAVVAHSVTLFTVLKWVGAAYLFWLGIQAIRASFSGKNALACENLDLEPARGRGLAKSWFQGFFCNVLNPKAVIFFLTFLPQFMDPNALLTPQFIILGLILMGISLVWFSLLAVILGRIRAIFQSLRFQQWLNRVAGGIFLIFGLKLVTAETP